MAEVFCLPPTRSKCSMALSWAHNPNCSCGAPQWKAGQTVVVLGSLQV